MKQIIIDSAISQNRVSLLENGDLVEYYMESRDTKRLVGNIYKGRVANVLPGMQAAFVDIGFEKNAFLYVKDAILKEKNIPQNKDVSIRDVVKNGEEIIVQVIKEPIDTKGPRVTKELSFPGRYLVLMPHVDYVGISRRIENEDERKRLKELAEEIRPDNMGLIIRTEAENKDIEDIKDDMKYLIKLWNKVYKEEKLGFAPKLLYQDLDLIHRTIRDMFTDETEEIIINDKVSFEQALEFVSLISPHLKKKIKYLDPEINIFSYYGIENMLKKALNKKVWLKSGGYIVIDKTEAMTVIDINTGKYVGIKDLEDTIIKINKEATKEIAKQIRLRDIGGIIIIDFIDMSSKKKEQEVIDLLSYELSKDRVKANVLGITQLGLLEMTRKKVRKRISSVLEQDCPYCNGTGKVYSHDAVVNDFENEIRRIAKHTNSEAVVIKMNPELGEILKKEKLGFLEEIQTALKVKILIVPDKEVHMNGFNIIFMGRLGKAKEVYNDNL